MLFLINCDVTKTYYLSDRIDKNQNINHIVDANDEKDAEQKLIDNYKDDPYGYYFYVSINYVNKIIT